jgi:hypothetical protein
LRGRRSKLLIERTTMYNAATYLAHMRRILEETFSPEPSVAWPDSELLTNLNEAQRQLVDLLPWLGGRSQEEIALTPGVSAYPFPRNLMGQRIQEVCVKDGSTTYPLERIPYTDALLLGMTDASQSGGPGYWAFDPMGQLLLLPTPDRALSLQLLIDPQPTPLSKVFYQPSAVVASGTRGASVLTLSAPDGTTSYTGSGETVSDAYWTGLELGFCPTNAALGGYSMPVMWARVIGCDMANGTLALDTSLCVDTSNAVFIAGQVSDLELRNPGRLGMLPAQIACIELLNLADPERAQRVQAGVQAKMAGLTPDTPVSKLLSRSRPRPLSRTRINL